MSDSTIISRLSSRFLNGVGNKISPDMLTRDIGGHFRNNQPYISGYFHIMMGLPERLFLQNAQLASQWLHSTCEGFTPHTQTLNLIDIQGLGQIGSSFISGVTTTREFTLTFREYQNMPVLTVIRQWASVIDPYTGTSSLAGKEFIPKNYKGWTAVAQIKPVRSDITDLEEADIEECYIYSGVTPTNIPIDTAGSTDITGNDSVQLSVTFRFDGAPMTSAESDTTKKVIELFKGYQVNKTYDNYHDALTAGTISQWGTVAKDKTTAISHQ